VEFDDRRSTWHDDWTPPHLQGWQHLIITRETSGHFKVYINYTLSPQMEVVDTTTSTSVFFNFVCSEGQALDNIVVSEPDPPPPEVIPLAIAAAAITVVVVVVIIVGLVLYRLRQRT
jgi:hypothetical protein